MAFGSSVMMAMLVLTGMLHSAAASTTYTVGANVGGWTLQDSDSNVYDSQFSSITLLPGDQLLFPFTSGEHNVYEVSQTDLTACNGANAINMYTVTNSTVTLSTAGYHGFICEIPGHCANSGMHLQVTVASAAPAASPTTTTTPAPTPTNVSPAPSAKAPASTPRAASPQAPSSTPKSSTNRAPTPTPTAHTPTIAPTPSTTRAPAPTPKAARAPAPSRKSLTTTDLSAPAPGPAQNSAPKALLFAPSMMVGSLLACALLLL